MVAVKDADVSWLSDPGKVSALELYQVHPDLRLTIPVKQRFWAERRILTLHDVIEVGGVLGLIDREVEEVEEAKANLSINPDDPYLKMSVRKEAADVVVFAKTYQTFANGTWQSGRGRVLDAVEYAKKTSEAVGGDLATDVIGVISGKNDANYLSILYDWSWLLWGRETLSDDIVNSVYMKAKSETRNLRDVYGDDGVLPPGLNIVLRRAVKIHSQAELTSLSDNPLALATVESFLSIYDVIMSKLT